MYKIGYYERIKLLEPTDTWGGFQRCAELHYYRALCLMENGWLSGAVYHFGYVVELLLKAAIFRAAKFRPGDSVKKRSELSPGVIVILNHNLTELFRKLVSVRRLNQNPLPMDLIAQAQPRVEGMARNWSEVLRYRSIKASPEETQAIYKRATWFLTNHNHL